MRIHLLHKLCRCFCKHSSMYISVVASSQNCFLLAPLAALGWVLQVVSRIRSFKAHPSSNGTYSVSGNFKNSQQKILASLGESLSRRAGSGCRTTHTLAQNGALEWRKRQCPCEKSCFHFEAWRLSFQLDTKRTKRASEKPKKVRVWGKSARSDRYRHRKDFQLIKT